jgi:ABC-type polysaccharide/polyol phosphate transport system ATPase subunit
MRPVISVENLSKRYLVGHREERGGAYRYTALRDVLGREMRNMARKAADVVRGRQVVQGDSVEEYWALKDVSFDVHEGEVLGIIGKNGAGKSTLLKILSRITEPTVGRVTLRGRVASLLEVGTGFHPELTGRENIFLNGAILGMGRAEIRKKFDEIVAFAEVERFLDTPVKRYSSGMYVRLAFAVAAHLEPEILIVDEVLAVGDAEFQKKCLGKMDDVSRREGRTVLFVSHNMQAIAQLTSRALLLERGLVVADDNVSTVLSAYYASQSGTIGEYTAAYEEEHEHPHVAMAKVVTSDSAGVQRFGEPMYIKVWIRHNRPLAKGCFGVQIVNQSLWPAAHLDTCAPSCAFGARPGTTLLQFHLPNVRLNVGKFHLRTWLGEAPGGNDYEVLDNICEFEVVREDQAGPWGWRPEICAYHEEFRVKVVEEQSGPAPHARQMRDAAALLGSDQKSATSA